MSRSQVEHLGGLELGRAAQRVDRGHGLPSRIPAGQVKSRAGCRSDPHAAYYTHLIWIERAPESQHPQRGTAIVVVNNFSWPRWIDPFGAVQRRSRETRKYSTPSRTQPRRLRPNRRRNCAALRHIDISVPGRVPAGQVMTSHQPRSKRLAAKNHPTDHRRIIRQATDKRSERIPDAAISGDITACGMRSA